MPSKVTATLVVNFGGANEGAGGLSIELDARPAGYNAGRSSFGAGDNPAFLVFATSDVTIDALEASAGSIALIGGGTMTIEEDLQFADVAEASLSRPFYNGFNYKWLGNNLGAPLLNESQVRIAVPGVGVLRISYETYFIAYRLNGVPVPLNSETSFPVLVVATGTKA